MSRLMMLQLDPDLPISIFDLDGTLVEFHKDHIWVGEEFTWDNFISKMSEGGTPIEATLDALKSQKGVSNRVIVTARPICYHKETMALLQKIGAEYDMIVFREPTRVEAEAQELQGAETEEEVKSIIFRHHSLYRADVLARFGSWQITRAYDDQAPNLEVWAAAGANPYLVEGQSVRLVSFTATESVA